MRDKILTKVEECFIRAEEYYGRKFQRPTNIIFKRNGTTAGYCWIARDDSKRELMFQLDLADANPDNFLGVTCPHEVAHYIQFTLYKDSTPHGREWQNIMWNVYRLNPKRCHNYDINVTTTKRQTRHEYKCACQTFQISTTTHNKIQSGHHRVCSCCRTRLVLVKVGNELQQKHDRLLKQIEALKKAVATQA